MLDTIILVNLVRNEKYVRKVLPFIKEEYFSDNEHSYAFRQIAEYIEKYNTTPTLEAMSVAFDSATEEQRSLEQEVINSYSLPVMDMEG